MFYKSCVRLALSCSLLAAASIGAQAGGFSKSTGGTFGSAFSQTKVGVKSKYFDYSSQTTAQANAKSLYNGKILEATGVATNNTSFKGNGQVEYKQRKAAKAKVYAKGGNVMAKARSTNTVTIYVSGKAYVVTREVARAVARFTPLGTTAAADNKSSVNTITNGYVSTTTGSVAKATVRVKN